MTRGAVSIGMMADFDEDTWNEDTDAFYSSGVRGANRAVNIVGWDDHFPKERFAGQPAAAGAWIVRNGWGTVFGEEGDFCSAWTGFPVLSSALARIRAMENTAFREVRLSSTRSAPSKKTSSPVSAAVARTKQLPSGRFFLAVSPSSAKISSPSCRTGGINKLKIHSR